MEEPTANDQPWLISTESRSTSQTILILKSLKPKSLEEFKVIVKGISRDTLLRFADNFCTIAKLCIQKEGCNFEYLLKKK